MPSFRQLLDEHQSVLLVDAASSRTQVSWFSSSQISATRWAVSEEESGIGVFRSVASLGVDLAAVRAFVFCDGPGSVLGIRTTAMAIRAWNVSNPRPVYSFCSLALIAQAIGRDDLGYIADARRESWHHYRLGSRLNRVPTAALAGQLAMPEHFRHWSQLPAGIQRVAYDLSASLPKAASADIFQLTSAPDAFLHEEPNYVTWTPQIHRASIRNFGETTS